MGISYANLQVYQTAILQTHQIASSYTKTYYMDTNLYHAQKTSQTEGKYLYAFVSYKDKTKLYLLESIPFALH